MNSMPFLPLAAAAVILFSTGSALARDTVYTGTLSGVECSACKKAIAQSLSKIQGVKTIRIIKSGEKRHKLEVVTDGSTPVSRQDANKALSKSDHYKILGWSKIAG